MIIYTYIHRVTMSITRYILPRFARVEPLMSLVKEQGMETTHNGRRIQTHIVSSPSKGWILEIQIWPTIQDAPDKPMNMFKAFDCASEDEAHSCAVEFAIQWINDNP